MRRDPVPTIPVVSSDANHVFQLRQFLTAMTQTSRSRRDYTNKPELTACIANLVLFRLLTNRKSANDGPSRTKLVAARMRFRSVRPVGITETIPLYTIIIAVGSFTHVLMQFQRFAEDLSLLSSISSDLPVRQSNIPNAGSLAQKRCFITANQFKLLEISCLFSCAQCMSSLGLHLVACMRYSLHRKEEAQDFIDAYGRKEVGDDQRISNGNASLCVAFPSVKRAHSRYLEIAVASLLQGLTSEERQDLHLTILVAETEPSNHPNWRQAWMEHAVDDIVTYNVSAEEMQRLQQWERQGDYLEKGVYDYVYALQLCYEMGSPYIGIFEDDTIVADGWLVRTLQSLRKLSVPKNQDNSWLYMRLFNQERSTGWQSRHIGGNHEYWIIGGLASVVSVAAMLARRRWRLARTYFDVDTVAVLVVIVIPALVILFFQSGKASVLPPWPGVYNEPFGCCTQAMVFPRVQVPLLAEYLQKQKEGQLDILLNNLARETGLIRYAMYPVQVQHVGANYEFRCLTDDSAMSCRISVSQLFRAGLAAGKQLELRIDGIAGAISGPMICDNVMVNSRGIRHVIPFIAAEGELSLPAPTLDRPWIRKARMQSRNCDDGSWEATKSGESVSFQGIARDEKVYTVE
nr:hypothetical protein CFP56_64610 [Quercus suber]